MAEEDVFNLIFKSARDSDGFQIFTTGKGVFADFRYRGGNGNVFQGFAGPECHFADFFQALGKRDGFQGRAERKRFLFNGADAFRNADGFQLALKAEDSLSDTDLRDGITDTVQNVFGIENKICGGFFLLPAENRNADDFTVFAVFHGADDIIIIGIFDDLRINELGRKYFGAAR